MHVGKAERRPVKAVLAVIKNPRDHFRFVTAADDCRETDRLTVLAKREGCAVAMNYGLWALPEPQSKEDYYKMLGPEPYPYDNNICLGKVVSDGETQAMFKRWSHGEGFGLTSDGRWGVGAFLHESFADEPGDPECTSGYCKEQGGTSPVDFAQYRSSWNRKRLGRNAADTGPLWDLTVSWIVQNGKNAAPSEQEVADCKAFDSRCDANGLHVTARTAVGVRANGELLLLTIDGTSGDYDDHFLGTTISELADLMLSFGAVEAINADGGGSTTMTAARRWKPASYAYWAPDKVDVLNRPSDCLKGAAEKISDDSRLQDLVMDWQPNRFCQRKISDFICIGDGKRFTVAEPLEKKKCDAEALEKRMTCQQTRFCKEAYTSWIQDDFEDDLKQAYEKVDEIIEGINFPCETPANAGHLFQKDPVSCAGSADAEDAFWHVFQTAVLADKVYHHFNWRNKAPGAAALARDYMDAGDDSLCSGFGGWGAPGKCSGDFKKCLAGAANQVNHAVGARLYREAWGPYNVCEKKWKMTRWGPRKKEVCEDKEVRPSVWLLKQLALAEVCEAEKVGTWKLSQSAGLLNNPDAYTGKPWYTAGWSGLDQNRCKNWIAGVEEARAATLAGSVAASKMDASSAGFFAGMAALGLAAVGTAGFLVSRRRRRARAHQMLLAAQGKSGVALATFDPNHV